MKSQNLMLKLAIAGCSRIAATIPFDRLLDAQQKLWKGGPRVSVFLREIAPPLSLPASSRSTSTVVNIQSGKLDKIERDLRRQLVRFSKWMHRLGYAPGTSGNLSVRLDDTRILATPTGCSKYLLRPSDMVITDLEGNLLSGTRNVTSEIGMHLAIYRSRPDIKAVVHAHPPIATAFASCGLALDSPLCAEIIMTVGSIPLAPYATTGTEEVGASLEPFLNDHDAILMANHGVVTCGKDLQDAFMKMETTEHFAQVCLASREIGSSCPLDDGAVQKLHLARQRYKANCHS